MLTQNPITPHDPSKMVRLKAIRPLFANGKRMEKDEEFEVQARHAGDILVTMRAEFVDQDDRGLVYKQVVQF
jgi:hypothetical protein